MTSVNPRNAAQRLDRLLAGIENPANRETVRRFRDERLANGVRPGTVSNELTALRDLCNHLADVRLEDATRPQLGGFVAQQTVERTWAARRKDGGETRTEPKKVSLKDSTRAVRRGVVKHFYRWLRGTDAYPPEVEWIRTTRPGQDAIPTDELVSIEDLKALLQAHPHPRDQAAMVVLYEAGLRAGELCALNVGSVEFDEYGAVLMLPRGAGGLKTGARRVRILDGTAYLQTWWERHPRKEDRAAPLFPLVGDKHAGHRPGPDDIWYLTTRGGKRAGLTKRMNPHAFRHTAATNAARNGWTEAMMRAYFGWSKGSDMPSTYVHLAGKDYEDMLLEKRGLKARGNGNGTPSLAPLRCRICTAGNPITATFCERCRKPLTPEAEDEIRRRTQEDLKEDLARLVAASVKDQVAAEIYRLTGISKA